MNKVFETMPEGWDAHAAHRRKALDEGTPQARKA
jgi:hypothetical protein